MKYYADGTVRRVTGPEHPSSDPPAACPPPTSTTSTLPAAWTATDGKYINDIRDYEDATEDQNNVLLWDNLTDQLYGISVIGSTLQIDTTTNDKYGFAVASDAKTVLIQDSETRSGKWTMMDDIYEYTGGSDGLERAVRNLNDNDEFKGFIGAVFTNGLATSIVIYDKTETDINTGIDTPQSTDYEMVAGSGRNYFTDAQIWAPNDDSTFSGTVAQTRALNALANGIMEAGYKVTRIDTSAWSVTYEDGDASITVPPL